MSSESTKDITAYCSSEGASVTLSFDVAEIVVELKKALEERLSKKGIGIRWSEALASSEVKIRLVEVDQGNRFLRWLLPFIAPAVLEVEGEISVTASSPRPFHYVQKVQTGVFGGNAKKMLTTGAAKVADKITKDILDAMSP